MILIIKAAKYSLLILINVFNVLRITYFIIINAMIKNMQEKTVQNYIIQLHAKDVSMAM